MLNCNRFERKQRPVYLCVCVCVRMCVSGEHGSRRQFAASQPVIDYSRHIFKVFRLIRN